MQYKQRLVRRIEPFTVKNGELYRMGQDNRLQRCLTIEAQMVMKELHEGPSKGHFVVEISNNIEEDIGCWILVANYV
jgi:hypothetical protein